VNGLLRRYVVLIIVIAAPVLFCGCLEPGETLQAHFTLTPSAGTSPLVVRFDASSSLAPHGAIVAYNWDFGDGKRGSGRSPAHTYATDSERAFVVTLTVTDDKGRQASESQSVTVRPSDDPAPEATVSFIWPFHYDASGEDAANLNDEYFALQNTGEDSVDLSGWTVENERGLTFPFPVGFSLAPDATVYVHSGAGTDSEGTLYWNASEPVWNNNTDIAILRDSAGDIIDVYGYAGC
jgi:PKD repeat protein